MLSWPQVTLLLVGPGRTTTPFVPVPVAVLPLRFPWKPALMLMAVVPVAVVNVLVWIAAVAPLTKIPVLLVPEKLLPVMLGAEPSMVMPTVLHRAKVFPLIVGFVPVPYTKMQAWPESVMLLLTTLGD